jgi:hypothetical protein
MKCQKCGKIIPLDVNFCAYCGAKINKPWEELPVGLERARLEVEAIAATGLDPVIRNLVIGLRRWGIRTTMSCQGHLNEGLPYPWVTFLFPDIGKLARLIASWNYGRGREAEIKWVIRPAAVEAYLLPEEKEKPLTVLQEEAEKLGHWLIELPDDWDE